MVTFWLSFISETDSVGTTIWRTARCCPSDTTRCSRLCLTLFSWPEYVLTTYQRNILCPSAEPSPRGLVRCEDIAHAAHSRAAWSADPRYLRIQSMRWLEARSERPRKTPATITNPITTPVACIT